MPVEILLMIAASTLIGIAIVLMMRTHDSMLSPWLAVVLFSFCVGFYLRQFYLYAAWHEAAPTAPFPPEALTLVSGGLIATWAVLSLLVGHIVCYGFAQSKYTRPTQISFFGLGTGTYLAASLLLLMAAISTYMFLEGNLDGPLSAKRFGHHAEDSLGRFTDHQYLLFKLAQLSRTAFYLFLLGFLVRRRTLWLVGTLSAFLSFLFVCFVFSNRAAFLIAFLDAAFLLMLTTPIRKFSVRKLIAACGLVFLAFLLISAVRSEGAIEKSVLDHLLGGRYAMDISKTGLLAQNFEDGGDLGLSDVATSSDFARWYAGLGRTIGAEIYGISSGVPPGGVIEAYFAGGLPFLILLFTSLGAFLSTLAGRVSRATVSVEALLVYVFISTRFGLFFFNNGIGVTLYQLAYDLLPLLVILASVRLSGRPHVFDTDQQICYTINTQTRLASSQIYR